MSGSTLLSSFHVSFPGLGIENISVDRIAFQIGGFAVYWYGLLIVAAFALCVGLAMRHAKSYGLKSDDIVDYSLFFVPASLIGARLFYVLSSLDEYKDDWLSVFDTRNGGLAVYGGVILAVVAVILVSRHKKLPIAAIVDFLIVYVPLGQAIGRWGNFVNQEAFGVNTDLPWGMISDGTTKYLSSRPDLNLDPLLPVHPTFLYESLATLLIFVVLLFIRKKSKRPYTTMAGYCILYGIARFFIEGLRTDSLYIGSTGLRTSQVVSILIVLLGIGLMVAMKVLNQTRTHVYLGGTLSEKDLETLEKYSIILNEDEDDKAKSSKEDEAEVDEDTIDQEDDDDESNEEVIESAEADMTESEADDTIESVAVETVECEAVDTAECEETDSEEKEVLESSDGESSPDAVTE